MNIKRTPPGLFATTVMMAVVSTATLGIQAATYPNGTFKYAAPASASKPANPPSNTATPASNDQPGIQAALNALNNSGGGTLNLSATTYNLNSPVTLRHKCWIKGVAQGSTIIRKGSGFTYQTGSENPTWKGLLQSNNPGGGIDDVRIRDVTVDGALNNAERTAQMPGFYGVWITSDSSSANRNFRHELYDVEIKNCGQGVNMGGTSHINIYRGYYHDNGGDNNPFFHNIYFRRVGKVMINQTVSKFSGGHGIKLAGGTSNYSDESQDMTIKESDCSRNDYSNLYLTGITRLRVNNNLCNDAVYWGDTSRGGASGIYLNVEGSVGCNTVDIVNNDVRNGKGYGIQMWNGNNVGISGNRVNNNAIKNYEVHATNLTNDNNTQ